MFGRASIPLPYRWVSVYLKGYGPRVFIVSLRPMLRSSTAKIGHCHGTAFPSCGKFKEVQPSIYGSRNLEIIIVHGVPRAPKYRCHAYLREPGTDIVKIVLRFFAYSIKVGLVAGPALFDPVQCLAFHKDIR